MPFLQKSRTRWAVFLAGGDGTRLQSLTLKIAGDDRPKQFCSIFGAQSLLAQTRARIEPVFDSDRDLFIVSRQHEIYYREELSNVDDSRIISQPLNRGTGVAAILAILHVLQRDGNAVVALVPCDHYYADGAAFRRVLQSALSWAEEYRDSIILLGAAAHSPEVEYGWIEQGPVLSDRPVPLLRVNRFWEKPSLSHARSLLRHGCLWNTFVSVGRAKTFLDLLCSEARNVVLSINNALAGNDLERAYRVMPALDFSRQVLTPQAQRLLAVRDAESGWADLGSPVRVIDILTHNNIQPAWLRDLQALLPVSERGSWG